jgi:hypothetical protein
VLGSGHGGPDRDWGLGLNVSLDIQCVNIN